MNPGSSRRPPPTGPADDKAGLPDLGRRELALLLALGERLASELDLETVLSLVADSACQVVQAETLVVPIVDPGRRTFTYRAGSGKYASTVVGQTFPIHEGSCGWVINHRHPLLFGEGGRFDLDTSAHWEPGMASSLLVPLISRGIITGGLSAMGKQGGGAFNEHDLTVLSLFANQAGIAIDNARLFNDIDTEGSRLRASEQRFRSLFDNAEVAMFRSRLDGSGTLDCNDKFLELVGSSRDEVIDKPSLVLWKDPLQREEMVRRLNAEGRVTDFEFLMRNKKGGDRCCVASLRLFREEGLLEGSVRDITESKAAADKIEHLAFYDPLTDLPNRRLLLDRLQHALASSARHKRYGALLLLDMDDFKTLNDTLGHEVGDRFLVEVAKRLRACVREGDTVARHGGDEFVVILENLNEDTLAAMQTESVAMKILRAISQPYMLDLTASGGTAFTRSYHCTSSLGATLFNDNSISVGELLQRADTAMYQAKAAGRNALRFFDPEMQAAVAARAALDNDLREAVRGNQFFLHYQPQIDDMGRMTGAEALVRWQHPRRGVVPPAEFIPAAEATGLILPLGYWVLETACTQLAAWASRPKLSHISLAINVSARQFRHPDFVDQVLAVLDVTGANPDRLKLELTESLLLDDVDDIIAKMTVLKARGVGFSLDDFGTGYSSLTYLKRLPLDQLKIDQSFVRNVLTDGNDAAIARTIVALAQSMGLAVIAEGVETVEQRNFLAANGCRAYQGYYFSRPLLLEGIEEFAQRDRRA